MVQEGKKNELLLTPFAQLLLKLKTIRDNVVKLTGNQIEDRCAFCVRLMRVMKRFYHDYANARPNVIVVVVVVGFVLVDV